MTTPKPEAPTLEDCIADCEKDVMFFAQIPAAGKQLEIATATKKFLERLRAIENARGMPEAPERVTIEIERRIKPRFQVVPAGDYDALRLHAQHLQDRLSRMESALREPSNETLSAMMYAWEHSFGTPYTRYKSMLNVALDCAIPRRPPRIRRRGQEKGCGDS